MPVTDSRITSPNHMNSMAHSMTMPAKNTHLPQAVSLSQLATPSMVMNSATEPKNGQWLLCGT